MTEYREPYPTIGNIIKYKDYLYINYYIRLPLEDSEKGYEDIFAGVFASQNGKVISLDGDTYSEDEEVIASEEWTKDNINEVCLSVVVEGEVIKSNERIKE